MITKSIISEVLFNVTVCTEFGGNSKHNINKFIDIFFTSTWLNIIHISI